MLASTLHLENGNNISELEGFCENINDIINMKHLANTVLQLTLEKRRG